MKANIFIPCIMDQLFPETAINLEKILKHFNVEILYNEEQTCCGQLSYKNGYLDHVLELGEKFIKEFNNGNYLIIPSISCAVMVKKYYPKIFYNSSQHNELKQLISKTYEFTDFLYNVLGIHALNTSYNANITIHTTCTGLRDYGQSDLMHKVLSTIKGVNVYDLPNADVCCGFGGSFSVKNHHISASMAKDKIDDAISTGADFIISNEFSCLMHLQTYAKKQKLPINAMHIVDFIALALNL